MLLNRILNNVLWKDTWNIILINVPYEAVHSSTFWKRDQGKFIIFATSLYVASIQDSVKGRYTEGYFQLVG